MSRSFAVSVPKLRASVPTYRGVFSRVGMPRIGATLLVAAGLVALPAVLVAQPELIEDPTPGASEISTFRAFWGDPADGTTLFWGEQDAMGGQLWRTDGTVAGTRSWAETCPGLCNEDPRFFFYSLGSRGVWNGERTFFDADDGIHGNELWTSDGTDEGTRLVADLCPGPCDSVLRSFTLAGDRVYFQVATDFPDVEPWVSDGTAAGTYPLGDLRPGPEGSFPSNFLPLSGGMAFQAYTEEHGTEWWWSDGTAEGTDRGSDLCLGSCSAAAPSPIVATLAQDSHGPSLYFVVGIYGDGSAPDYQTLYRWAPNPVEGQAPPAAPQALRRLCDGDCNNLTPFSFAMGDRLYVTVGDRLWSTDGSADGTRVELDLPPEVLFVRQLLQLGNGRQLMIADGPSSEPFVWAIEGSTLSGPLLSGQFGIEATPLDDEAVLVHSTDLTIDVWRTDGTEAGTVLLQKLDSLQGSPTFAGPPRTLEKPDSSDVVIFAAETNLDFFGRDLWATRGQPGDLERLAPATFWPNSSEPRDLVPLGRRISFLAFDPAATGHPPNEVFVGELGKGASALTPQIEAPVAIEGVTLGGFPLLLVEGSMPGGSSQTNLWISTGDDAETYPLWPDPEAPLSFLRDPVSVGNHFYFLADQGEGQKLLRSMGIRDSTELVIDIDPDWFNDHIGCPFCSPPLPPGPIYPRDLSVLSAEPDPRLAFVARADETGAELWQSDGTTAGTRLVADLRPGVEGSDPENLLVAGSRLLFTADDGTGRAWWLWSGEVDSEPERLVRDQPAGTVIASTTTRFDGVERAVWFEQHADRLNLYVSDGTEAGTYQMLSYFNDLSATNPVAVGPEIVAVEDRVYFVVDEDVFGAELYYYWLRPFGVITPIPAPVPVGDLRPGSRGSYPEQIRLLGGKIYFTADDGETGRELWQIDPEVEPLEASLVFDLAPGPPSSSPQQLVLGGSSVLGQGGASQVLYFVADDGLTGREVWGLDLDPDACVADATHHCLQDGLFRVSSRWRAKDDAGDPIEGVGWTLPATRDTGYFYFFDEDNLELATKVLDGRATNGAYWVFYGALSDVEYWIDVEELATGNEKTYYNPPGNLCGDADVNAFPSLFPDSDLLGLAAFDGFGELAAASSARFGRAEGKDVGQADGTECVDTVGAACVRDRFSITVEWRTADAQGIGRQSLDDFVSSKDTALFWFFDSNNVELAVKVLDGRTINDRFWVYFGALSDVEYTVRVVDTETGAAREYTNQQGNLCGQADIEAF